MNIHSYVSPVKIISTLLLGVVFVASALVSLPGGSAGALSGSEFNPGNIVSDYLFYNSSAMNAAEIQGFLNSKVPVCDTDGTKTHSSGLKRWQWAANNGHPAPPYVCLKDKTWSVPTVTNSGSDLCSGNISGGTKTSAQVIFDVAQACTISPQVLLILLQKEQSLVTDDWPWPIQYEKATGFGCPDTAPCDPDYSGFFYQVYNAGKAFRRYRANPTNYNYRAGRNNTILWHPNAACGTSTVWIDNQATAGLYIYTPYRPNQAALNNLGGLGDSCSSYGNRNFWKLWREWFGDTQSFTVRPELLDRYNSLGGSGGYLGKSITYGGCGIPGNGCYQNFQNGHIYWSPDTGAWDISGGVGARWITLGAERSYMLYPTTGEIRGLKNGGAYQQFQIGRIYWSAATGAWDVSGAIGDKWTELGAQNSLYGYPQKSETRGLKNGGAYQQFQIGRIYWSAATGAFPIAGGIGDYWLSKGAQNSTLGYPTSGDSVASTLGNRLTGNTLNGDPVGYLEYVDLLWSYYSKLSKKYKVDIDTELQELHYQRSWNRLCVLIDAEHLDSENNMQYLKSIWLAHQQRDWQLQQQFAGLEDQLRESSIENNKLREEVYSIKHTARRLAGNIKRRLTSHR